MRAGIGAIRNAVAVHVEVAAEILAGLQLLGGHHLAAVDLAAVVPGQRFAQPVVHADLEIEHHEDRRLKAVRQIERQRARTRSTRTGLPGTAARAWCRRARHRRSLECRSAACGSACRWRGRRAARRRSPRGFPRNTPSPTNSCISEMPGPEVAVNARAPFHAAPITMPIEASSSSAWTMANLFFLVCRIDPIPIAVTRERFGQRG